MSKSSLYRGLGIGLMSFGDGLAKQMAETARQRREESLLAMKRQWDLDDRDFRVTREDSLLDRSEEQARIQAATTHADSVQRLGLADQMERDRTEWELGLTADERARAESRTQEMHNADVRYKEAQTESAEALAKSRLRQQENLEANRTAVQRNLGIDTVTKTTDYSREEAKGYFTMDRNSTPSMAFFRNRYGPLADSLGITDETPLQEARKAVEDWVYANEMERLASRHEAMGQTLGPAAAASGVGLLDVGESTVDPTEEWNAAMAAIEAGAPVELVIEGMRQRGVPEDIIEKFKSGF